MADIKVSVAASCVMGKCRSGVFKSVFCDVKESMDLLCNGECRRDNAVSLYFLEISLFTRVGEPKVFENNVWNIYSAPQRLYTFFVSKLSYVVNYKVLLQQIIQLFDFFHIFTISRQPGFPGVFTC